MLKRIRNIYQGFPRNFWIIPMAVCPLLAGLIIGYYNPDWVWYAAGILVLTAAFGLLALDPLTQKRLQTQTEKIPLEVS